MVATSRHAVRGRNGPVAQWSELAAHNRLVGGSSPPGPTTKTSAPYKATGRFRGMCPSSARWRRNAIGGRVAGPATGEIASDRSPLRLGWTAAWTVSPTSRLWQLHPAAFAKCAADRRDAGLLPRRRLLIRAVPLGNCLHHW